MKQEIILEGQNKLEMCNFFGVDPETHDIVVRFQEFKTTYECLKRNPKLVNISFDLIKL